MPRYFFDVDDDAETKDADGTVLADVAEARLQGILAAGEMFGEDGDAISSGGDWVMKISDETRTVVCTIRCTVTV